MKWDEKAREVHPKELPLRRRLLFARNIARTVNTVKGVRVTPRQRLRVFYEAFTADVIIIEQEEES